MLRLAASPYRLLELGRRCFGKRALDFWWLYTPFCLVGTGFEALLRLRPPTNKAVLYLHTPIYARGP